jgi:phosphate-selective porin OprO and OprP
MIGGLKTINRYLLAGAGIAVLLAVGGGPAHAQDVQQLEATMKQMQAQMAALQKQVEEAKAAAAAAQNAAAKSSDGKPDFNVKWKGAPELSSSDGKFSMKVRGRLQVDYEHVDQDTPITTYPDIAATELRRARLGVEGVMWYDWKYLFEVDFAAGNQLVVVKDAYVQYQGWKIWDTPLIFRVGNFKTPNTFEDLTSDNYVDTMERANFINAWNIDPEIIGGQISYWAPHWGLTGGIFGETPASSPLVGGFNGDENLVFAARGTVAPINRDVNGTKQVLFFGASVRTRDTGDDQQFLSYKANGADFHLTNAALASGNIGNSDVFWGLESAGLWGPFAIQGEYGHTDVNLPGGQFIRTSTGKFIGAANPNINPFIGVPDPAWNAWYVEASWFFGGHKTYNNGGWWDRPVIDHPMFAGSGSWGGLQIVGKYDVIDQGGTGNTPVTSNATNYGATVGACQTTKLFPTTADQQNLALCGDMKTWLIGVNWYPNDHIRFMFNYAESTLGDFPFTPTFSNSTTGNAVGKNVIAQQGFDGATVRGFGMRAQIDW